MSGLFRQNLVQLTGNRSTERRIGSRAAWDLLLIVNTLRAEVGSNRQTIRFSKPLRHRRVKFIASNIAP